MLTLLIVQNIIHQDVIKNEVIMKKKNTYRVWYRTEFGLGCELIKAENKRSLKIPKRIKVGFLYAEKE